MIPHIQESKPMQANNDIAATMTTEMNTRYHKILSVPIYWLCWQIGYKCSGCSNFEHCAHLEQNTT